MSGGITSVVFVGVAGQPVVSTARLLAEAGVAAGQDVTFSEYPAALPGSGSVAAHVRIGEEIASPCISEGEADVLVAFEQIEALRGARLLAPHGFAAVNERLVPTWRMRAGFEAIPRDVLARIGDGGARAVGVRGEVLARSPIGDILVGIALLGVVSHFLPIPDAAFDAALATPAASAAGRWRVLERGRRLFDALPDRLAAPASPSPARGAAP